MKRFITLLMALIIALTAAIPTGAYDFPANTETYLVNDHKFLNENSAAVKWNGRTALKENTYYYTTTSVTVSKDMTLPKSSTLEIRKPLKLTKGAELTVKGNVVIDYDGKLNPYKGTLTVKEGAYIHCYGALAISKGGTMNTEGLVLLHDAASLALKGKVNILGNGEVINSGSMKQYQTAKVNGEIIVPDNITELLSEHLDGNSDNEKICVDFMFYDTRVMERTKLDGMNFLDATLKVQNSFSIPYLISEQVFGGEIGSYKKLAAQLSEKSTPALRWLKTNYGSARGFKKYLAGDFFKNISDNPAYGNENTSVPSDNRYVLSDEFTKLMNTRSKLAEMLNDALYKELTEKFGFEALTQRNRLEYGYGVFSAEITKSDIIKLSKDERFMFLSINDGSYYVDGHDKLFTTDANDGYAVSVVLSEDIISGGSIASDKAYSAIDKYTDVIWNDDLGAWYDTGAAGTMRISFFSDHDYNGMYRFHSFTDDLYHANHSVSKNYLYKQCRSWGLIEDCMVYHRVDISSEDDIAKLAASEDVLYIFDEQMTIE